MNDGCVVIRCIIIGYPTTRHAALHRLRTHRRGRDRWTNMRHRVCIQFKSALIFCPRFLLAPVENPTRTPSRKESNRAHGGSLFHPATVGSAFKAAPTLSHSTGRRRSWMPDLHWPMATTRTTHEQQTNRNRNHIRTEPIASLLLSLPCFFFALPFLLVVSILLFLSRAGKTSPVRLSSLSLASNFLSSWSNSALSPPCPCFPPVL